MTKIGILGGGQLGKMFIQNAKRYPVEIHILDPNPEAPCAYLSDKFVIGDFKDYTTVMSFAEDVDIIGIEIEHVNLEALKDLKEKGKKVIPDPEVLEIIQDKRLQKQFYLDHDIPTAPLKDENELPVVQKLGKGGYDGKGVQILTTENQEDKWSEPSVFETPAKIEMEMACIVCRNERGETAVFPIVEQVFNPEYNLLDYLLTPARISDEVAQRSKEIGLKVVDAFDAPGIYAVELFLNEDGSIWVNETAPRVHNSGHSTIESAYCSQFDMMLRILMNYPLGSTELLAKSAMWNIIGEKNHTGNAHLENLDQLLKIKGGNIHWYGKAITKPGRKMGHVTFISQDYKALIENIENVKNNLKCVAK